MTDQKQLPEALSIDHVAKLLSVHPTTVRRWIRSKYIRAYRVGPFLIRIPRTEVARMRTLRVGYDEQQELHAYPRV